MKEKVTVSVFGAFREWAPGGSVVLELPEGARVSDARRELARSLRPGEMDAQLEALIGDSVFADESTTLDDGDVIAPGKRLAVLPPVCGG